MSNLNTRIREAVSKFDGGSLRESAAGLLGVLGYKSDRVPMLDDLSDFLDLGYSQTLTRKQRELFDDWTDMQSVFQFTADELPTRDKVLAKSRYDVGRIQSFVFLAVELKLRDGGYARGRLANMNRAVNRLFAMPVVVVYRYRQPPGNLVISVAVVHHRPSKKDKSRDVLERVTLIKDIRVKSPHRAHLDVLAGLSLPKLTLDPRVCNFRELHEAWERALETEPLNRQFYQELFSWFERAVDKAVWPTPGQVLAEQQVIRCITRILFVWFIKEKGFIAEDWFDREQMDELLVGFGGSDYYRAVLQNLFFATLNAPSEQRGWSTRRCKTHRVFSRWRYHSLIRDTQRFEKLMKQTPFINGGLFDCLDDEKSRSQGGKRIDMFTDPDPADSPAAEQARQDVWKELDVPDELFFDDEGLIPLLNRYKFTVEENTPAEVEVALDPELLGKVFEHLLASYNPETRETARNQTGSYYTPRSVVDYMVDEALVIALADKAQPADGDADFWHERLKYLFDYEDAGELFDPDDADAVVRAIAKLKILDPAVGSGAFPMAVLNKLTLALRRLDPENELWQKLQIERAAEQADAAFAKLGQVERDKELRDISKIFERYTGDFGRKLYLIQNSIFGVDKQAIACHIAKLRFFISLAIEQERDPTKENDGIKPLPNLETRFVAANTLVALQRDDTHPMTSDRGRLLEEQLLANRERHFHATLRSEKLSCMKTDKQLRGKLVSELQEVGLPSGTAAKIAKWNPYDQNRAAPWFDPEYMFGIEGGFDVVIGNPPYIQLQRDSGRLGKKYKSLRYATFAARGDIYQLFIEKGCRLLRQGGVLAYITSNSWLRAQYGRPLREYLMNHEPVRLVDMGKDIFDAVVDTSVLIVRVGGECRPFPGVDIDRVDGTEFPPRDELWGEVRPSGRDPWTILSELEWRVMDKMKARGRPLKDWDDISIYRGVTTGYNEAFIVDDEVRDRLVAEDPKSADILKPILRGRDIQRYRAEWAGLWLIATLPSLKIDIDHYPAVRRHLMSFGKERLAQTGRRLPDGQTARSKTGYRWFEVQTTCAYHAEFAKNKVFWMDMSPRGRFAFCDTEMYCNDKGYLITGRSLKWCCAVLNSRLVSWMVSNIAITTGAGLPQWKKFIVESIPIPVIPDIQQESVLTMLDRIVTAKQIDSTADTAVLEKQLDQLVYDLYGLCPEEVRTINAWHDTQ